MKRRQPRAATATTVAMALLIAALSLSACAIPVVGEMWPAAGKTPVASVQRSGTPDGQREDRPAATAVVRLIERAREDLVQATGAGVDEITVVSAEEVEWSDASLGCPEPGFMYAQVMTPGYRIVLESDGKTYDYHSATDPEGPLAQCAEDGASVDVSPANNGTAEGESHLDDNETLPRLIERAIEDLAQMTNAAPDEVTVVSAEEVEWSDTSLGCPEPDGMYAQMITPGYRIVLESGGETYDYHSGTDPEGPLAQCSPEADNEN